LGIEQLPVGKHRRVELHLSIVDGVDLPPGAVQVPGKGQHFEKEQAFGLVAGIAFDFCDLGVDSFRQFGRFEEVAGVHWLGPDRRLVTVRKGDRTPQPVRTVLVFKAPPRVLSPFRTVSWRSVESDCPKRGQDSSTRAHSAYLQGAPRVLSPFRTVSDAQALPETGAPCAPRS